MMRTRSRPLLLLPGGPLLFPDPRTADAEGLLAVGGDLSAERLLFAYDSGIFPWHGPDLPLLWWSPDPRTILDAKWLHVSRSLRRTIRKGGFEVTWNHAFAAVMAACADRDEAGTWIVPEMMEAYAELHRLGHAHSLEVWHAGVLTGGLYGVQRGGLFAAESMFHRRTDASKIALVAAVRSLFAAGISLFDVQFLTEHLASLGARDITRTAYLRALGRVRGKTIDLSRLEPGL